MSGCLKGVCYKLMKTKHREKLIEFLEKSKEVSKYYDILSDTIGMEPEGKLNDNLFMFHEFTIDVLEELISGNNCGWIEWYIWENNYGEKEMEAGPTDDLRKIKNVDDLIWLLEN